MSYLIGVDEAGYGPNLGPLCISATLWHLPDRPANQDLYDALRDVVESVPTGAPGKLVIADSKQIYSPDRGITLLEENVLSALTSLFPLPASFEQLCQQVVKQFDVKDKELATTTGNGLQLPVAANEKSICLLGNTFREKSVVVGVQLRDVSSFLLFANQFNRLLDQYQNKSSLLSHVTLGLVKLLLSKLPEDQPRIVYCDKHGGRNRYGALLQTTFPDYLVEVYKESGNESIYRWGPPKCRTEVRFTVRGERFLPSALSSMVSKYLRELSMLQFNRFWRHHLPEIRPTAGYPVDARRFKHEIAAKQTELGIADDEVWRKK